MATFTLTTPTDMDALTGKAGDDTYNVNGTVLTVNTDSRWGKNTSATIGPVGNITVSSTLGGEVIFDARNVRLIPYNTGSGNVPAAGATISQGGVSGELIGVWSALNTTPTAAGAAMPASGYIKLKFKTGGDFAAGALTGIGASATGADTVGWLEIVGCDTRTITCARLGKITARGEWFELGTTDGNIGQTFQVPCSGGSASVIPAVEIETGVGTGIYEVWSAIKTTFGWSNTYLGTDQRSMLVQDMGNGQIRIGSDGTNNVGYVPSSGRKVRIPNLFFQGCTLAAKTVDVAPNATITARYEFAVSSSGQIDFDKACFAWYTAFGTAYKTKIYNTFFIDTLILSNHATPFDIYNVAVTSGYVSAVPFDIQNNTPGGVLDKTTIYRYSTSSSKSGWYTNNSFNVTLKNSKMMWVNGYDTAYGMGLTFNLGSNLVVENVTMVGTVLNFGTVTDSTITNIDFCSCIKGTTSATFLAGSSINTSSLCNNITLDGLTFGMGGVITGVQPYNYVISSSNEQNGVYKNVGSIDNFLNVGSDSLVYPNYIINSTGCKDMTYKRIFVNNTRGALLNSANTSYNLTLESVMTNSTAVQSFVVNEMEIKGGRTAPFTSASTGVFGSIWYDFFTSDTLGKVTAVMHEPTEQTASQVEITNGNPQFTAAGTLTAPTVGDQVVWTMPYFALGHTGFDTAQFTNLYTLSHLNYFKIEYQIDTGSGFGSWKNLNFFPGDGTGSTVGGSPVITLNSTTGIQVGDFIRDVTPRMGAGAKVLSVDSSTQVTVDVNSGSSGAISQVRCARVPDEAIDPAIGFKLKLRLTTAYATTNAPIKIEVPTTSTLAAQHNQYPLETIDGTLTLTGLQVGTEVHVYDSADDSEITATEGTAGTTFTYSYSFAAEKTVYITILKEGYQWLRLEGQELTAAGLTVPIFQNIDRTFINPA